MEGGEDMHIYGDNGLLNPGITTYYHILHDYRFIHLGPVLDKNVV